MQHGRVGRIVVSQEQIARRVGELAQQIVADHSPPSVPDARQIIIAPVLTGAMIFCADLIRRMPIAMKIGLLTVSSYPGRSTASQGANLIGEQLGDIRGRHIVLVDDILDSGGTLRLVVPMLQALGPASVRSCVLLRKDRPSARQVPVDYVGFDIADEFVVGYGLDYDNYYRNLPDVVTLKMDAGCS